eukprot:4717333-Pyramimonas_sp.AAC.1
MLLQVSWMVLKFSSIWPLKLVRMPPEVFAFASPTHPRRDEHGLDEQEEKECMNKVMMKSWAHMQGDRGNNKDPSTPRSRGSRPPRNHQGSLSCAKPRPRSSPSPLTPSLPWKVPRPRGMDRQTASPLAPGRGVGGCPGADGEAEDGKGEAGIRTMIRG